ncbi:MAG TPA: cytochrome P450 [Nostocaceae cyanobacterium]|nr:cytochrome P450 [Nostocaceae cyanobacterium]
MTISAKTQTSYDLLAPEVLFNPYPLYQQIRADKPVYFYEKKGFWFLTRYQDVEAALLDPRLSSNRQALLTSQLPDSDLSIIQNLMKFTSNFIVEKDPPIHTDLKDISTPSFTDQALASWQATIQNITDNVLDEIAQQQSIDVVADLSLKIPSMVTATIFDVPEADRENLIYWSKSISNFWGFSTRENIQEVAKQADVGALNFTALIQRLVTEHQQQSGNSVLSLLINAFAEKELNFELLPSLGIAILGGDYLITSDMIANGIYTLLSHPHQWQKLKENPELVNSAIEELMRFDNSLQVAFRFAKENLTIGGVEIPAGSIVALAIGAANRDPEKFDNPEVFDITRSPNEHLSFGKGIHYCLGAALARMELKACFSTLIRRLPNLHFDPDRPPVFRRNNLAFKGFESLHVKF